MNTTGKIQNKGQVTIPTADDDYAPAQRKAIDARLAKAERGPVRGPFHTADDMIAHMKTELKKRAAAKKLMTTGSKAGGIGWRLRVA